MKKFIDYLVLGVVGLTTLGVAGGIIWNSYADYQVYYKENYPEIDPADYAVMYDMRAEIKDGVTYYANNKAKPIRSDFIVTGTYRPKKEGMEDFEQVLDPIKRPYIISTPNDFAVNGGDITISYSGLSYTIPHIVLTPLRAVSVEIANAPYKTVYQEGSYFSKTGMVVNVKYNDGSTKVLNSNEYTVANTALNLGDSKVVVNVNIAGNNFSIDQPISVVKELNNGELRSLTPVGGYGYVNDRTTLSTAEFTILGTYASGNKVVVNRENLTVANGSTIATFGNQYTLDVVYTNNSNLKTTVPVKMRHHLEGENATELVGGTVKTEKEYTFDNGSFTEVGNVTHAGGFAANASTNAYVTYKITSQTDCTSDITIKCANSFLYKDSSNRFWMKPLQVSTIADLFVNDEQVPIQDDVIIAGCGPTGTYQNLYNVYTTITFKDVPISMGFNNIKLKFKPSTLNEVTNWNESPSTMNIDYINIDAVGSPNKNATSITRIYFDPNITFKYGEDLSRAGMPIYAEHEDGSITTLSDDEVNFTRPTGIAMIKEYTLTATLKADTSLMDTKIVKVSPIRLEAESATKSGNDRVVNYKEGEYEFNTSTSSYHVVRQTTVVKGMDYSTTNYSKETSLTFTFTGYEGLQRLIIRCDNANFRQSGDKGPYSAAACNLNQCVDIYVNGTKMSFSNSLPAINNVSNPDICWMTLYTLNIGTISVKNGTNTIKIVGNKNAPKNYWNECSIPRFDYIEIA